MAFLVIAIVFFVAQHELTFSLQHNDSLNPSAEEQITQASAGSTIRRIGFLSLGLLGILSLPTRQKPHIQVHRILGLMLLVYIVWGVLSITWTDDLVLTFRRLVLLLLLIVAALGIAKRCSLGQVVAMTWVITVTYLLVGVSAELVLGTLHPFTSDYRFAGTVHPNHQGINCALLLLSAIAMFRLTPRYRLVFIASAASGTLFLLLTKSRTAVAGAVLAIIAYWSLTVFAPRRRIILASALTVVFTLLAIGIPQQLSSGEEFMLLGRRRSVGLSLDGRIPIWDALIRADQHLLTGYGYGAFWNARRIEETSTDQQWGVAEGHSAYLDTLLNTGLIGLALYLSVILTAIARSVGRYRKSRDVGYAFCTGLLLFCLLDGVLESASVNANFLSFLSFITLFKLAVYRNSKV